MKTSAVPYAGTPADFRLLVVFGPFLHHRRRRRLPDQPAAKPWPRNTLLRSLCEYMCELIDASYLLHYIAATQTVSFQSDSFRSRHLTSALDRRRTSNAVFLFFFWSLDPPRPLSSAFFTTRLN